MISKEQAEARKKFIGSSDAAAIMGLDPYRSAADLWLEKTGKVESFEGNEHTERGNLLEPMLLDYAEKRLSAALSRDLMKVHDGGILAANFDGIQMKVHTGGGEGPGTGGVNDEPFIVEAKTSAVPEEWGEEEMTDQVPERVIVQAHHQLYVAGAAYKVVYVPLLLAGYRSFDFKLYRIQRNDALADAVAEQGTTFYERFIKPDIRPDDFRPSLEVLKRMKRTPNKVVSIPATLADEWNAAKVVKKQAEEIEESAKVKILAALMDADGGDCGDGRTITYMETQRKAYAVEASSYRTLRMKGKK